MTTVRPKLMSQSEAANTRTLLGHTVLLPCPLLLGNPPPSRHWYKDNTPVHPDQRVIITVSFTFVFCTCQGILYFVKNYDPIRSSDIVLKSASNII